MVCDAVKHDCIKYLKVHVWNQCSHIAIDPNNLFVSNIVFIYSYSNETVNVPPVSGDGYHDQKVHSCLSVTVHNSL